jgi:hypothetical protein
VSIGGLASTRRRGAIPRGWPPYNGAVPTVSDSAVVAVAALTLYRPSVRSVLTHRVPPAPTYRVIGLSTQRSLTSIAPTVSVHSSVRARHLQHRTPQLSPPPGTMSNPTVTAVGEIILL